MAQDGSEHRFFIVVDPDSLVQETNELNNTAVKILSPEATYDLEVLPGDVTVAPGTANMLQEVRITARISNKGTMNAYNAHVRYFIDVPGNPFEIATQTVDVPAGSSITNEITWQANKAGENMPLAVQIDPYDREISESNNKVTTTITVNTDIRPNLAVSYTDIVITPSPGNERGTVTISALVKNNGFSSANNIGVRFYRGVPCSNTDLAVTIGNACAQALQIGTQQTIATLGPGENSRVSVDWVDIPESGQKLIYVEAYTETALSEIADNDNYAFIDTFTLRTLPDLAISTNSIVFSPAAPKEGDQVKITLSVRNTGEQTASDVVVRLSEGSVMLGNLQTIPILVGGGTATVLFSYDAAAKGAHTFTAVVDPGNEKIEQSKDNNSASRTLGVQDSSLWVTEQYISPNGDGVKDSTELFFRLEDAVTVSVRVLNKKKETVRTFTGPELVNTTSGSIVWNGLNDSGVVVDDGEYQLQVQDNTGSLLAVLQVTADNNRSPLTDAIGTKNLLNNNLTCMLPDSRVWNWRSDESGILVKLPGTPEYPNGIYSVSPDGVDIIRLVPNDWNNATNAGFRYEYDVFDMAPDGEKIAISLTKYNKSTGLQTAELWLMDSDGSHLTLLDTIADGQTSIYDVKWSPVGDSLYYITYRPQGGKEDLRFIKADGTGGTIIDSGLQTSLSYVNWSPDGSHLAYVYGSYDSNRNYIAKIKVSDIMGNKQQVFDDLHEAYYQFIYYFSWLNENKLMLSAYGYSGLYDRHIWLVNPSGNNNHINVGTQNWNKSIIWPAPGGRFFAFNPEGAPGIAISDSEGNIYIRNARTGGGTCVPQISDIVWSTDGGKMAFSERLATCGDCPTSCNDPYGPHVIVVDANTKQEQSFALNMNPLGWMLGGRALLGYTSDEMGQSKWSLVLLNLETGESSSYPMLPYAGKCTHCHKRYPRLNLSSRTLYFILSVG